LFMTCFAARAAEVHVSFAALERMLGAQMFTDEGRRYVRGSRTEKCNFAWLEKPHVQSANGRLLIRARFTGKTSVDLFGRCIGLGDSFALSFTATPFFKGGHIGLKDVKAAPEGGGGFYANRVCAVLAESLERDFRYPLAAEAKRGLEDPGAQPQYPRQLRRFDVTSIRVTEEALILVVDFVIFVQ
jgi:hypothetical protein